MPSGSSSLPRWPCCPSSSWCAGSGTEVVQLQGAHALVGDVELVAHKADVRRPVAVRRDAPQDFSLLRDHRNVALPHHGYIEVAVAPELHAIAAAEARLLGGIEQVGDELFLS